MDEVWSWYDAGGGESVDQFIAEEYNILLNLAGIYMPVRNGWWIISLARFIVCTIILSYDSYLLSMTVLYTIHDLNFAAETAHYALFTSCSIILLFSISFCRPEINKLMTIIGNNFYKYQYFEEPKEHQIWKNEGRNIKVKLLIIAPLFALLTIVMIIGGPTFDTFLGYSPREKKSKNIDFRLPLGIWHPYSKESTSTYIFYLFLEITGSGIAAASIGFAAVFMVVICIAIIIQLKILQNSLSLIKERAFYRHKCIYPNIKPNDKAIKNCLIHCVKENVEHHKVIIKAFTLIYDISYIPTGFALMVGATAMAISCSALILGDATPSTYITSFLLLIWELANQAIICYFGQEIADKSLEIQDSIYQTDWIIFPKEVKLSLTIIRERAKQPLVLKAMGLTPLSYETFSSVINAAYSYLNLLLASKDNNSL